MVFQVERKLHQNRFHLRRARAEVDQHAFAGIRHVDVFLLLNAPHQLHQRLRDGIQVGNVLNIAVLLDDFRVIPLQLFPHPHKGFFVAVVPFLLSLHFRRYIQIHGVRPVVPHDVQHAAIVTPPHRVARADTRQQNILISHPLHTPSTGMFGLPSCRFSF